MPEVGKLTPLPIDSILPRCWERLRQANSLVLRASPGSGKTTRFPIGLLRSGILPRDQSVWVLEPRRLAAKFAAHRVASEAGESVGNEVGYHFRLEKNFGAKTRLLYLTEGMLMRRLLAEPNLASVGAVVLDEFHERHLHGDVALASLRRLQLTTRPDLKIAVMSATLDSSRLCDFLQAGPELAVDAPLFPVSIHYQPPGREERLDAHVRRVVRQVVAETAGDILVFLPGMAEIRRADEALRPLENTLGLIVFTLHGDLDLAEQQRALAPAQRRKVILSTNLAETSLTIEGVSVVIDAGLMREAAYSPTLGLPSLRTVVTSRASAVQRAGRAGRLGPGRCIRLFSEADFQGRRAFDAAEITRADLAQTFLELSSLGRGTMDSLTWLEPPPPSSWQGARELLTRLGALSEEGAITPLGTEMSRLPVHPRLARLIREGGRLGCEAECLRLATLVSEGEDTTDLLSASLMPLPSHLKRAHEWLKRSLGSKRDEPGEPTQRAHSKDLSHLLAQCALAAFPDRLARRRPFPSAELLLAAGGTALLPKRLASDPAAAGYFLALDLQMRQSGPQSRGQCFADKLIPIEESWLFELQPSPLITAQVQTWDRKLERMGMRSRLQWGELVLLEEEESTGGFGEAESKFLLAQLLGGEVGAAHVRTLHDVVEWLAPLASKEFTEGELARAELFRASEKKSLSAHEVLAVIWEAAAGCQSRRDLEAKEFLAGLAEKLAGTGAGTLDRLLPTQLELPSGRRAKVEYRMGKGPWVESRIQDFFGMTANPRLLRGEIALTLHLLAPNYRAVQVTQDLTSFWKNQYPSVRRELSRDYPRHAWPENPLVKVVAQKNKKGGR